MALQKVIVMCLLSLIYAQSNNTHQELVNELEEYIKTNLPEINQRYRLQYHISGPVGWINDPNGFSFYKGEYHMFFQYYPYDSKWGPMHWGHMTSPDLVHWKQLPTALVPEEEMCFSGSAVVDGDKMVLMYTGRIETDIWPGFNETQYLAFSDDGVTFEKFHGNPVIGASYSGLPDFRDPKTWKHGDFWYTVIGSRTIDARGEVLLFRSPDLISWEFLRILAQSDDPNAYMWECPDFFELDGKFILLISPQGMHPEGDRYKNVHQNGYIIGSFNYDTYEFIPEVDFQEIDYGHDFYAAQTTDNNGKRYIVGWFSMWDVPYPEAEDGWAGALTIVRELSIENNRIIMKPVPDMLKLRDELVAYGDFKTNDILSFGKAVEIIIRSDLNRNIELQLEGTESGNKTWIRWNANDSTITVDRENDDYRRAPWTPFGARSWRLFLDSCSLELFCGEGEAVFSSRAYPDGGWKITNLSPQVLDIEAYTLESSIHFYNIDDGDSEGSGDGDGDSDGDDGGNSASIKMISVILTIFSVTVTSVLHR